MPNNKNDKEPLQWTFFAPQDFVTPLGLKGEWINLNNKNVIFSTSPNPSSSVITFAEAKKEMEEDIQVVDFSE